jgi:phenylalanyl-tRNA synthetase beta chain
MTISYNWLSEYLPSKIEPERLSKILTAIGLEVESLHRYESIKGSLAGLITAEVLSCEPHPDADKLKVTAVNTGKETLQVVCGASNVAAGQKVILATPGTTIYPSNGDPLTLKKVKIRGVESDGMICAEDEIGVGSSHDGIMVLPAETAVGLPAASLFETYEDGIFEIGLTPNRMDAMSHLGVAKDVCAYLTHHDKVDVHVKHPFKNGFKADIPGKPIEVVIENSDACRRYAGISISGIEVQESPAWLKNKLKTIGLNPINNIVDITNFILHETGQPLHAFDAHKIKGNTIIVKNVAEGTPFVTLDGKEKKLTAEDLLICNADEPMCMAGIYGGQNSGVTSNTTDIFLESAWFNNTVTRKSSVHHGLRTDAATRFEKGVDISNTIVVLKRAAELIKEVCGGEISSDIIDVFPNPIQQVSIGLKYHYLKKLSGKNYHGDSVKNILKALGFEIMKEGIDELWVNVPHSKPDITLPADLVEEIMRIDGLDNIDIPATIQISPSHDSGSYSNATREKVANILTGIGFYEIFTNSITNSAYFDEATLQSSVKMINNLSAELDILRPTMLPTGMEVISHNINRKNTDLCFYEFGNTYHKEEDGKYNEVKHLSLYVTGNRHPTGWNEKASKADFYFLKAACEKIFAATGVTNVLFETNADDTFETGAILSIKNKEIGRIGITSEKVNKQFGIKQPVLYADLLWEEMLTNKKSNRFSYREISKFPSVQRDLALVVNKAITYVQVEKMAAGLQLSYLQKTRLFDIFESDKLGANKKSMAVNFTFEDSSKTLTDAEIDEMMNKIIAACEKQLQAEIRK